MQGQLNDGIFIATAGCVEHWQRKVLIWRTRITSTAVSWQRDDGKIKGFYRIALIDIERLQICLAHRRWIKRSGVILNHNGVKGHWIVFDLGAGFDMHFYARKLRLRNNINAAIGRGRLNTQEHDIGRDVGDHII